MDSFPGTEKKLKSRISSYKSALKKEKENYGYINDGTGKRYLLFALYFVLNDLSKTADYFDWFSEEFDDDIGEPIQKLCWAVSLLRMNKRNAAKYALADLMLQNLYVIPKLLCIEIQAYDMWHASSDRNIDYYDYIPKQVLDALTPEDMNWIKDHYESFIFRRIRQRHVVIYKQFMCIDDFDERGKLLREADSLLDQLHE